MPVGPRYQAGLPFRLLDPVLGERAETERDGLYKAPRGDALGYADESYGGRVAAGALAGRCDVIADATMRLREYAQRARRRKAGMSRSSTSGTVRRLLSTDCPPRIGVVRWAGEMGAASPFPEEDEGGE